MKSKMLSFFSAVAAVVSFVLCTCGPAQQAASPWDQVPEILSRIVPPVFPDRDFLITDYGAIADGTTKCSEAFRAAIEACHKAGGGRVVVPSGNYLTGPIHLKSNVNLHLAEGSTLLFSKVLDDYLPLVHSRQAGVELMNYSPLIYAFEQENIAVTGSGTLNGQADTTFWWPMMGIPRWGWKPGIPTPEGNWELLYQMVDNNVPVSKRIFPNGIYYRPPFIQPYRSRNILIEGVTVINSPFWCVTPELSQNVTIRNVTVRSHGPNNDGCNPVSCKDVLIEGCYFDTGDDCIAIKSGRDADGRRVNTPSENIIIRNCRMKDGHGGVVIGSEISGGIRNVFAEDCVMDSPQLNCGLRIKTNSSRGGYAENIFLRNIQIGEVGDVISVNYYYPPGDVRKFTPVVRNIHVENVTSKKSNHGLMMLGYDYSPISGIHVKNCRFDNALNGNKLINVQHVTIENVTINGKPFTSVEDEMVPPAVMATLQPHLERSHILQVDKHVDGGMTVYDFVLDGEGGRKPLAIAENGILR